MRVGDSDAGAAHATGRPRQRRRERLGRERPPPERPVLRSLYDRVILLSQTRWALPALAATAFTEASFFPVPPDALLAPMVLARRERAWLYAFVCTAASVLGGLLGYAIGVWLEPVGLKLLALFGHGQGMDAYRGWFAQNGFWVILAKGLTPIPFKLVTIASGFARFDLGLFVLACALTRSGRFFLEAALLQHPAAKSFVERHLVLLVGAAAALLVLAVVATRLL
jgi:membrane protein YqaA with SNARE-associated domain